MKPKIRLFDNSFGHAKGCCNGNLPIGPAFFDWDRSATVHPITVFTGGCWTDPVILDNLRHRRYPCPVMFLVEPPVITPTLYYNEDGRPEERRHDVRCAAVRDLFDYILTYDMEVVALDPAKCRYHPHGGCWIMPEDRRIYPKTKGISLLASDKQGTAGQKLRHEIAAKYAGRIDLFGNVVGRPIESKLEALRDYRFTVVIENCAMDNYFSEKLIDPLVCGTVPIYHGSPRAHEKFPGLMCLDDLERLVGDPAWAEAIYAASPKTANFAAAQLHSSTEDWLWLNFFSQIYHAQT